MEYIAGRKYLINEECREKYGRWIVSKESRKNVKWIPCHHVSDKYKILWVNSECIEREETGGEKDKLDQFEDAMLG